ncbi:hypothetical protein IFM89_009381 [Coptis chinensis]|uniref:Uncharacterized protein n=1 Tax=Coptis chinensis TaxID=261450 RepID=A0A835HIW5_9MAGN|nr:hypothetical protein IFM89_009381 [Coptis chinensis]
MPHMLNKLKANPSIHIVNEHVKDEYASPGGFAQTIQCNGNSIITTIYVNGLDPGVSVTVSDYRPVQHAFVILFKWDTFVRLLSETQSEIQPYKFAFAEFGNISSRYKQITNLIGLSFIIIAASFSFDTTKNISADEKLEASLNKSPPQVVGRPSMIGLNFRPALDSSGRISVRKIDNHQNFVGSFMLQPRGMDVTSPHSTDWRGGLGARGMKSGIVGRTGSGKTTLKQTVLCLVEPTAARQILLIKGGFLYCKPHFAQLFKDSANFNWNFQLRVPS